MKHIKKFNENFFSGWGRSTKKETKNEFSIDDILNHIDKFLVDDDNIKNKYMKLKNFLSNCTYNLIKDEIVPDYYFLNIIDGDKTIYDIYNNFNDVKIINHDMVKFLFNKKLYL